MFHRLVLLFLTFSGHRALVWGQSKAEAVSVEARSNTDPFGDLTEVSIESVYLSFKCESANSPTEWVFDYDTVNVTAPKFPCDRTEWSYRWHSSEGFINKSFLKFTCPKFQSNLAVGCRSVTNHSDNVLVNLEPNQTTGKLYITQERGAGVENYENRVEGANTCVLFTLVQLGNENYWKCGGPDGNPGKTTLRYCDSGQDCANTQRKLKLMPVCVETLTNVTHAHIMSDNDWLTMDRDKTAKYPGGTVVCRLNDDGEPRAAALEFFFAGKNKSKFHFSFTEISMNDLIWFDPMATTSTAATLYTGDKFGTRCKASEYGLAWDPRLTVTLNGSKLMSGGAAVYDGADSTRARNLTIEFGREGFGPGLYEIECSALVWNTSEWATQALQIEVFPVVDPSFDVSFENVTVKEGDSNVRLMCDALGDPEPNVTWSHAIVPGLRTEGRELIFTTVSAQWVNGTIVSCAATNKYGQQASKTFKMHVNHAEAPFAFPTGTILAIAVLLVILLALGTGLCYLYLRFKRFGGVVGVGQVLSDEEVNEFRQGNPASGVDGDQLAIECLPYNSEFEMTKEDFYVDFSNELGSGQHGVVYEGRIKQGPNTSPIVIAVKTVRENVPVEYLKALLSELKILAYIGEHDNIARLVGAYSSNIKNRELFVGVEFCKTSLLQHLRAHATKFVVETSFSECECENVDPPITTLDLIRWSAEIAAGMEYLTRKRVVHGDLAARNVLLSFEMQVKICDFGLARQLVNYSYMKRTKCYLPWKWMAIESLRHRHFSTMSDVWAYGVTCWEIFSLGEVPYPCMEWSWEFVDKLEAGNRLKRPKYASPEIFSILIQCWFARKERRPSFAELGGFFQEQGRRFATSAYASAAYVSPDEFIA